MNFFICMILWGFLGQVNSEPFLEVTSGRLWEELNFLRYNLHTGESASLKYVVW